MLVCVVTLFAPFALFALFVCVFVCLLAWMIACLSVCAQSLSCTRAVLCCV